MSSAWPIIESQKHYLVSLDASNNTISAASEYHNENNNNNNNNYNTKSYNGVDNSEKKKGDYMNLEELYQNYDPDEVTY